MSKSYLIVKLAAAGDVLLSSALATALNVAHPTSRIAWLTTQWAAPLLESNPEIDKILVLSPLGVRHRHWQSLNSLCSGLTKLRAWTRQYPNTTVLLTHRDLRLAWTLRAAGLKNIVGYERAGLDRSVPFDLQIHRLKRYADLLRAVGIVPTSQLKPRLFLRPEELLDGEKWWNRASCGQRRWIIAPGGASNPWSAMPNRLWTVDGFLELAKRACAAGIALCWMGGPNDSARIASIVAHLPEIARWCAGATTMRHSAAIIAAADLVVGNDSLPIVLAQALDRPALGLYGPTPGARIHAPGQPFLQGQAGCGPCYNPRAGRYSQAYLCPRARCMEALTVDEVWRAAAPRAFAAFRREAAYA